LAGRGEKPEDGLFYIKEFLEGKKKVHSHPKEEKGCVDYWGIGVALEGRANHSRKRGKRTRGEGEDLFWSFCEGGSSWFATGGKGGKTDIQKSHLREALGPFFAS